MYDGKRIIPAPFVSLNKTYQRTEDNTPIGSLWEGTITGKIVAYMGSPDSTGTFWTAGGYPNDEVILSSSRLASIIRKQEALRELFSEDGHQLEFQSEDGSAPMKCNPRITGLTFQEGPWFQTCDFTITFQADVIYINGTVLGEDDFDDFIESASEEWQIETNEDQLEGIGLQTFRLTHQVRAKGKRVHSDDGSLPKQAWERARDWVLPRLGLDTNIVASSGIGNLPSYFGGYNHVRSESIGELDGNYSITENWILASGGAIEDFDISVRNTSENSLTTVSIDGRITGLELRDANQQLLTSKYDNALAKFNSISGSIISKANLYSGKNINPRALSVSVGRNPIAGTISYSYELDDRPPNLVSGAISETISIQDSLDNDVIAVLPIVGRRRGPILQDIFTKRESTRTLTVELVMPVPTGTIRQRMDANPSGTIEIIANEIAPTGYQVFQVENTHSWDIQNGRYSLNRQWIYEL